MEGQHEDRHLVIGITGRIGSGKSEVAGILRDMLGFRYLRYSLVLAEWRKADPSDKRLLQDVGWAVMDGEGQIELNTRLIGQITQDRDFVIDGLRHPIDYESLKTKFGLQFHLIYVSAPSNIRFQRLAARFRTWEDFLAADSHAVESNIESLRSQASAIFSGSQSRQTTFSEMESLIAKLRIALRQ